MKRSLFLLGLMVIVSSCISQNPKEMNTERLTYFSFDHHNTMAMFSGEKYQVSAEKDGRIHVVIDEGYPKEKDFYINDSTIFEALLAIVKQYKMDNYRRNYQPEMRIFDGDSWSLYYKYDSKRSVSSGGYMDWPENYGEARNAISEYFKKWREYAIEAKKIDLFQYTSKNNHGCDIDYRLERGEEGATLSIRNAEYNTDKQFSISNDYLDELQELVNTYRLKDEISRSTDDDNVTTYRYLVCYNNGDTLETKGYYTTFLSGMGEAFMNFFDRWLPIRGNLVRLDYSWESLTSHNISYYVSRSDDQFSLIHFDENGQKHECNLDNETIQRLQKLIESFGLDKAKDEPTGRDHWTLFAFYDTKDTFHVAGQIVDEASETKGRQILEALRDFFAPYLK